MMVGIIIIKLCTIQESLLALCDSDTASSILARYLAGFIAFQWVHTKKRVPLESHVLGFLSRLQGEDTSLRHATDFFPLSDC